MEMWYKYKIYRWNAFRQPSAGFELCKPYLMSRWSLSASPRCSSSGAVGDSRNMLFSPLDQLALHTHASGYHAYHIHGLTSDFSLSVHHDRSNPGLKNMDQSSHLNKETTFSLSLVVIMYCLVVVCALAISDICSCSFSFSLPRLIPAGSDTVDGKTRCLLRRQTPFGGGERDPWSGDAIHAPQCV